MLQEAPNYDPNLKNEQFRADTETQEAENQAARIAVYDKINEAVADGTLTEFSAGPDYKKATGLSREEVLQLGSNGYAELVSDAVAHKAEQDAAAADAQVKQERQDAANEHAANWRAEIDAKKAVQQETDSRVQALSYREKLANGGELGLKNQAGLAEKITADAVAQAKAEGLDTSHLEATPLEVPANEAAVARQSELVAAFKEHRSEVLKAQADKTAESSGKEGDFTVEDQEKLRAELALDPAEVITAESTDPNDAGSVNETGVRNRLRTLMQKTYTWAQVRGRERAEKVVNYLNDTERNGERADKRKQLAVIGTVIGATAIYVGMKYGLDTSSGGDAVQKAPQPNAKPDQALVDVLTPDRQPAVAPQADTLRTLTEGQNPWNESVDYAQSLGYNVSNSNPNDIPAIDAIKDSVMKLNNISDASNLPVGMDIRMPSPEQMEEIMKQYNS